MDGRDSQKIDPQNSHSFGVMYVHIMDVEINDVHQTQGSRDIDIVMPIIPPIKGIKFSNIDVFFHDKESQTV